MQVVLKAAIRRGDTYLSLLRSKTAKVFPDYWDFPGGKLEPEETPEKGIVREILEETTLKVTRIHEVAAYELEVLGKQRKFIMYEVETFSGDVAIGREHQEFAWLTKEEILERTHEPFIDEYFQD